MTMKGARPGSPLADAIFHLMMRSMLEEFRSWVATQHEFVALNQDLDLEPEPIVWSDGIAVAWATRDGHELPGCLRRVVQQWDAILQKRGFQLNLARGKTSIVASFRGPGAPAVRQQY